MLGASWAGDLNTGTLGTLLSESAYAAALIDLYLFVFFSSDFGNFLGGDPAQ